MVPLHSLIITSPDGTGRSTAVRLDGRQIYPLAVTVDIAADKVVTATIVFDAVDFVLNGMTGALSYVTGDEKDAPPSP